MHAARDAEDVRLLERGEYGRLLSAYYPVVVGRCLVRVREEGRAYDVAHDVVERLLAELRRGRSYGVPFRVVVHKVIDWKLREHFTRGSDVHVEEIGKLAGEDPYEEFEGDFDLERLFAGMPPRDREVLTLR